MQKNNFNIEFVESNLSEEKENRIFEALNILINLNDIYDKKNNVHSVL